MRSTCESDINCDLGISCHECADESYSPEHDSCIGSCVSDPALDMHVQVDVDDHVDQSILPDAAFIPKYLGLTHEDQDLIPDEIPASPSCGRIPEYPPGSTW